VERAAAGAPKEAFEAFLVRLPSAGPLSQDAWRAFYKFVVIAFDHPDDRPSVSWIATQLRPLHHRPGHFAVAYAHGIYILGTRDGQELYEGGLNP
jgi:hypothetical protein